MGTLPSMADIGAAPARAMKQHAQKPERMRLELLNVLAFGYVYGLVAVARRTGCRSGWGGLSGSHLCLTSLFSSPWTRTTHGLLGIRKAQVLR